jgi:hypothetical protein
MLEQRTTAARQSNALATMYLAASLLVHQQCSMTAQHFLNLHLRHSAVIDAKPPAFAGLTAAAAATAAAAVSGTIMSIAAARTAASILVLLLTMTVYAAELLVATIVSSNSYYVALLLLLLLLWHQLLLCHAPVHDVVP